MPLDVIAVPRSRGIVLAAVVDDGADPKPGLLSLVAEDGARFRFPAEHAIERVRVDDGRDGEEVAVRLAALRERLTPFSQWLAVHGQLDEGERVTVAELAEALGDASLATHRGLNGQ